MLSYMTLCIIQLVVLSPGGIIVSHNLSHDIFICESCVTYMCLYNVILKVFFSMSPYLLGFFHVSLQNDV